MGQLRLQRMKIHICSHPLLQDRHQIQGKFMPITKDREAFRTLVESLVQMTTFISRIFLQLVELEFKVPISAEQPSQYLDLMNFLKIYDIKHVISADIGT